MGGNSRPVFAGDKLALSLLKRVGQRLPITIYSPFEQKGPLSVKTANSKPNQTSTIMKKITICLLLCLTSLLLRAAEGEWLTDLPKAQAKAKAEKKMVLIDFTGSDWCPPCKALSKNVLTSKEFIEFASKNLVLVELDFPNRKPQAEALKKANAALSEKFKIEGYPTVIVLDSAGKELFKEVGYGGTTAKDYIAKLQKLIKQ